MRITIIAHNFFLRKKINIFQKLYIILIINKFVNYINNLYLKQNLGIDYDKYDNEQLEAILCMELKTFVIAGAGSGKTSLIIGKVQYLIEELKYSENEILCISYTNDACNNLKNRLKYKVDVLTFHKLAQLILNNKYIINNNYLKYVIDEYFESIIYNCPVMIKKVLKCIKKNNAKQYGFFLEKGFFDEVKYLIQKYINLFIVNDYDYAFFLNYKYSKNIMSIIIDIYTLYIKELNASNEVDLNILIKKACNCIEMLNKNYKYIIIDEYQDISKVRYEFIDKLVSKLNAKLLVVGDDYQSIYKFSGSDLNSFFSFDKNTTKVIKLKNNYRCCKEIVHVASRFICKNNEQVKKCIKAHKSLKKCINLIKYKPNILYSLLIYLCNKKNDILILGRNRNDIDKYIKNDLLIKIEKVHNIKLRYKTVHSAKGLEGEVVILLNLTSNINGFPNRIKDDKIINKLVRKEKYLYAEERRLFYVALTRSKGEVYIIEHYNQSIFLREIKKIGRKYINYLSLE